MAVAVAVDCIAMAVAVAVRRIAQAI